MGLLKRLPTIIGPILLVYIFARLTNAREVVEVLKNASPIFLVASAVFNLLLMYGKIHRLYFLLNNSSIPVRFFSFSKIYASANFLGQVSNYFMSDVVNAGVLMVHNEKKMRIVNIFIFSRILDLLSILLLFLITLAINIEMIENYLGLNYKPLILFSYLLLIILPCIIIFRSRLKLLWRDLRQVAKENIVAALLYSGFIYFFYGISAICNTKALNLDLPKSYVLLSYLMGSLITVVPISVAGIGTRDVLFIFFMSLVAISPEKAVSLSGLGFLFFPFISLTMIYMISFIGIHYEKRSQA